MTSALTPEDAVLAQLEQEEYVHCVSNASCLPRWAVWGPLALFGIGAIILYPVIAFARKHSRLVVTDKRIIEMPVVRGSLVGTACSYWFSQLVKFEQEEGSGEVRLRTADARARWDELGPLQGTIASILFEARPDLIPVGDRLVATGSYDPLSTTLLENPAVARFYKSTWEAWTSGALAGLSGDELLERQSTATQLKALTVFSPDWATMGLTKDEIRARQSLSYDQLVEAFCPFRGSALWGFFINFPPQQDEWLVDLNWEPSWRESPWFVLTNQRLLQRDGPSGRFLEVTLRDLLRVETRPQGFSEKRQKMLLEARGDRYLELSDLKSCPPEPLLMALAELASGSPPEGDG